MGVKTSWYDAEKTIIYFKFTNPWTWEDFFTADRNAGNEVKTFDHLVDAVFDFTEGSVIPKNALTHFSSSAKASEAQPNQGTTVVFGMNMFLRSLGTIIQRVIQTENILMATDLDDALQQIAALKARREKQETSAD